MSREDGDVYYLQARTDSLPMVVAGAVAADVLSIDDISEVVRSLIADIAERLRDVYSDSEAAPEIKVDPHDSRALVSVSRIVADLDLLDEGATLYVNRETGEIRVQHSELDAWHDEEESENGGGRQELEDDPAWVALLSSSDLNDLEVMRRYASRVAGPAASREPTEALHGRGLYRRFRDVIARRGLANEWHSYHEEHRAGTVRFALQQHGIAFRR